jgi:hypothetical protein
MFNQSGVYRGVPWGVTHLGGREFELKVGEKTEKYTCLFEPIFGLDTADQHAINLKLDEMQGLANDK